MRRLQLLIALLAFSLVAIMGGARLVSAHAFHTGNSVIVSGPPLHQTVFASGKTVDISSEVFGDVFCAGQTLTVSGTVHGDVICAGQSVTVSGKVDGDIRLAGQSVNVSSVVGGNATIGAQSFVLDSKGSIGGDLSVGATDTTLNGSIGRDVAVSSSTVLVANHVGRNVQANTPNLKLASSARVDGNITLISQNKASIAPGAVVTGQVIRTQPTQQEHRRSSIWRVGWLMAVYWLLALLVLTLVLTLLLPRGMQAVTDAGLPWPWKALGIGFVACIVVPIVLMFVAVTIIGLPLAFLGGLFWMIILLLSGPVTAYWTGRLILRRAHNALLVALVGAAVVGLLYFIPFLNILVFLAVLWVGTGMVILSFIRHTPKPAYAIEAPTAKKD